MFLFLNNMLCSNQDLNKQLRLKPYAQTATLRRRSQHVAQAKRHQHRSFGTER